MVLEGLPHEGQRLVVLIGQRRGAAGIGVRVGPPGAPAEGQRERRHEPALGEERRQLRRLEPAEAFHRVGRRIDEHQARGGRPPGEPRQQVPEIHRAEEILLEPQHDLVVPQRSGQAFLLLAHDPQIELRVDGQSLGQERRPSGQRRRLRPFGGQRALDEDVAPDEHVAREAGGGEHGRRDIAVEHVKHGSGGG